MSEVIAERAVVIGAGMGGLAAARAVAPFFDQVTVLDRDALPEAAAPRIGTPQPRHVHALLSSGERALENFSPALGATSGRRAPLSSVATTSSLKGPATIRFPVAILDLRRSPYPARRSSASAGGASRES